MSKTKIIHYLSSLDLGGTSKTAMLFANHLDRAKFDVGFAYFATNNNIRLPQLKSDISLFPLKEKKDIGKLKADILHVYQTRLPNEFPVPGMDTMIPHFVNTNVFGGLDPNPNIDADIFMSQWLMDFTLKRFKMWSIPDGIQGRVFDYIYNPVESPCTKDKLDIKIPEDHIVLGRCGRPDNGIYHAINVQAAHLLQTQGYKIFFLVMAPPSNMVDDLVRYQIPYHVIEPTIDPILLSRFYNTIHIYAHARADGESFGVNIAEAMMHSKPVVTHKAEPSIPGMGVFQSQTQLVDRNTGFVVNNDVGEYTEVLKKLIDSGSRRFWMGYSGQIRAEQEFHVNVCIKKLERIYLEIMNEN